MPELPASNRRVLKATYVPLKVDVPQSTPGRAVQKYAYVRRLNLQPGEVAAVRKRVITPTRSTGMRQLLTKLSAFEGNPLPSQLPPLNVFVKVDTDDLTAFGKELSAVRSEQLAQLSAPTAAASRSRATARAAPVRASAASKTLALSLLNTSLVATNALAQGSSATPIGMLNLERLEMVPAGIQRGELIATIPLAPMEQTSVVQKEWSVTSQEFTSIVTDSLDNYSETGVTENTELAQSTTTQNQHSNQFNVNATVSGNVNFATIFSAQGSVDTGFTSQDQNSQSATASATHAIATTKKASTRVKQEHKVTISTSTVSGTSETTTRTLQNPSATTPMRIDYFSLMRKWHVSLYRYGLRLTYDIVIPEPAGALRGIFAQLAALKVQAGQAFTFPEKYSDITDEIRLGETEPHYLVLADRYGAQVPAPAAEVLYGTPGGPITGLVGDNDTNLHFKQLPLNVPDDYQIADLTLDLSLSNESIDRGIYISGYGVVNVASGSLHTIVDLTAATGFMAGFQGSQTIDYSIAEVGGGDFNLTMKLQWTDQARERWVASVWNALYNAAQTSFYANQQVINSQIQALQDQLTGVDTLTLRREEHDEITKGVLRWLLGPGFDFMPPGVSSLFSNGTGATWGNGFPTAPPNELGLSASDWSTAMLYEQMVRFINDAIDWDNIMYFLYSYFWDVPTAWDNIRTIQHPDSTRQAFLRAGSARVVLTVRKGWETAWVQFVEGGQFDAAPLPELHPYLAIAQEIQDYDNTNYPGIPPANPGGVPLPDDDDYVATVSSSAVAASTGPVSLLVTSSAGFIVGYTAIIDSYESGAQETQTIVALPDATHVTVGALTNAHGAAGATFAVLQAGEKGVLIAEWFEYTPSSGTDIAVTSNLATIA